MSDVKTLNLAKMQEHAEESRKLGKIVIDANPFSHLDKGTKLPTKVVNEANFIQCYEFKTTDEKTNEIKDLVVYKLRTENGNVNFPLSTKIVKGQDVQIIVEEKQWKDNAPRKSAKLIV